MARIINSPGVQITEKDLSLRAELPVGTAVLVPGFAPQGPVAEPLFITTASELEAIYGTPTTAAERYFYYSCREVLNSPAVLTTLRLPYGDSNGVSFAKAYSILAYPVQLSGTNAYAIGAPNHYSVSPEEYQKISEGNFDWSGITGGTVDLASGTGDINAGFLVLNELQVTNNELFEGYYVGFSDNSSSDLVSSPDFDSITSIKGLTADDSSITINTARLDFVLSATKLDSDRGMTSVSESLEKVGFIGFETTDYQDHLSFSVFRLRRSTSDPALLTLASTEKYIGSFDSSRKESSPAGGTLTSSFIEEKINGKSPTIKFLINPAISKDHDWTGVTGLPTTKLVVKDEAKNLQPLGIFVQDTMNVDATKKIGNVPGKLDKSLRILESIEDSVVDVIVDAGLSTIYSTCQFSSAETYNEETYINDPSTATIEDNWQAVTNKLVDFCQNSRKDCMAIIDPHRSIFVQGRDSKVINNSSKTFTQDIYAHLKNEMGTFETSYAATYANWVKIPDYFGGRNVWQPFSGYAAAVYARSDAAAQTWAAPAGLTRGIFNVLDIAFNPNMKQRDRLYEISVNPVVLFPNEGYSIYGQKTLQTKPTAFDRINVRRLFLTLERATQRAVKYYVFEPNTQFTRKRLVNTIAPLFEIAKRTEGVYDFLIVCDERNNTPDSIDRNELIVDIYLKPVRTAEFILVNFIATRTGQNFQELI
jgi:hypothetical protein